jgi:uncharacterized RDD family membrane protein YckC
MQNKPVQDLMAPGILPRLACWLYEGLLLFSVSFVAGYGFSVLTQSRHALTHRTALMVFLFLVFAVYFTWCWHKGQTLAMKTWRLQVVNQQGQRLSMGHALVRYLLSWLWFAPPLTLAWLLQLTPLQASLATLLWVIGWAASSRLHPHHQFWHDAWAKTFVVTFHAESKSPS